MKRCLIFLLGAGLAVGATAQVRQHISFGPTIGFGHSWLSANNAIATGYENKFHAAYNVGVKLVYSINPNWGVSGDLKYSSEGGSLENNANSVLVYRSNYIRIPLQGIYFFEQLGDRVRPKISLGPSFGFLIGGDTEVKDNGEEVAEGEIKDVFQTFDFGLTGALGANIRVAPNTWLNTDIGYYHGLTNINEVGSNTIRNRNLGLNVGLAFGIGDGKDK